MNYLIFYAILALSVSFICSLLESILLSISPSHVAVLAKEKSKTGLILEEYKANINRPLAAILSINTIANVVGATGVGAEVMRLYGNEYIAIASAFLTLSILIFSEIIPKTLGATYWRMLLVPAIYVIKSLIIIAYPFVYLSEKLSFLRNSADSSDYVSREEMIAMAEIGEDAGTLGEQESDIIENILNLRSVSAEEVMTPRSVIFALQKDLTVKSVMEEYSPLIFSRIPVYDEELDDFIGMVLRYDLVNKQAQDDFNVTMEQLCEPIVAVKEMESVASILDQFVKQRQQIFMVTDDFGTTTGIITLEDAIETLLGVEIVDEHDSVVDMRKLAKDKLMRRRRYQ